MKHTNIMVGKQGYARRNRGAGTLDWAHLIKVFPLYRKHIARIRKNTDKLYALRGKLVMKYGLPR